MTIDISDPVQGTCTFCGDHDITCAECGRCGLCCDCESYRRSKVRARVYLLRWIFDTSFQAWHCRDKAADWPYHVRPADPFTRQRWEASLRDDPEFGSGYGPTPHHALDELVQAMEASDHYLLERPR